MSLDQNIVVVVDIEATCWKSQPPAGEQNEIIEIGVCVLDIESGTPAQKRSLLVKPTRSKVSHFCTKLTTLTQEQVDDGMSFREACGVLESEYHTKSRLWVSWGDYDRRMFKEQCASFYVSYPFSDQHMNLKEYFAELQKLTRKVGMARALKMMDLPLEGTHHRGHDDAWNIARIMTFLVKRHGRDFITSHITPNDGET